MINISDLIQLQNIEITHQPELKLLMKRIYPPAYKSFWSNEDCSWYLNKMYDIENFSLEFSEQNSHYYFIIYNSKKVGILRLQHDKPLVDFPDKKATYLHRIYLGEEAQGKGVAKQIMDWTESSAKLKGSELIWLKAMDTQLQALRFYEKHGFSISNTTVLDFELIHKHLRGMNILYKFLDDK